MAAVTICRDLGAPQNKGRPEFEPWVGKIPWRRKWQPTPVFLPGESQGWGSLVGFRLFSQTRLKWLCSSSSNFIINLSLALISSPKLFYYQPSELNCFAPWNKSYDKLSLLKSRDITLPTKVHLVKAMVFPVVMYGCESWTIKKAAAAKSLQSCLTLCDPINGSPPGSSVHRTL